MALLKRSDNGSVLILSLWVSVVLFLLIGSLAYRARIDLQLSRYQWEEIQLSEAAKRSVQRCVQVWRKADSEPKAYPKEAVSVTDESSRINLNQASGETLRRLFDSDSAVVPAILAWRTSGNAAADYSDAPFKPRHGPFRSVEELRLVKGITPEIFRNVEGALTVYGDGNINLNTAEPRVLAALGLSPFLANRLTALRRDGGVFTSLNSVLPLLKRRVVLSDADQRSLATLLQGGDVSVRSDSVRLRLKPRLKDSRAVREFLAVVSARTSPARILYWRELDR